MVKTKSEAKTAKETAKETKSATKTTTKKARAGGESTRARKAPAQTEASGSKQPGDIPEYELIAEAAYYKAEKRGFSPGFEMRDWLEAECELSHQSEQEVVMEEQT